VLVLISTALYLLSSSNTSSASDPSLVAPASTEAPPAPLIPAPAPFHCGACGFGSGEAFAFTLPAESMPDGRWAFALRTDFQDFKRFSDAELVNYATQGVLTHSLDRSLVLRAGMAHALSDTWTIGADVPFIQNTNLREGSVDGGTPHVEDNGDQSGLGDASVFAQWKFHSNQVSREFASLYLGVKLPTGYTNEKGSAGDLLEPDHQPGSGSTDPFLGLAFSKSFGTSTLGSSVLYRFAGHGSQDSNLGDILRANVGIGWSSDQSTPEAPLWRWMLEVNAQWQDRASIEGATDVNSGGSQIFLAPGMRVTWHSGISWFASIGVPLAQNLYGVQSETYYRASTGVGVSF
jgi:hypothetical protein